LDGTDTVRHCPEYIFDAAANGLDPADEAMAWRTLAPSPQRTGAQQLHHQTISLRTDALKFRTHCGDVLFVEGGHGAFAPRPGLPAPVRAWSFENFVDCYPRRYPTRFR
jgi:hypothetical protein